MGSRLRSRTVLLSQAFYFLYLNYIPNSSHLLCFSVSHNRNKKQPLEDNGCFRHSLNFRWECLLRLSLGFVLFRLWVDILLLVSKHGSFAGAKEAGQDTAEHL